MSLCSPFGEYELELDVKSYSEEDSKLEKRVSWAITDGFSGVRKVPRTRYEIPLPPIVCSNCYAVMHHARLVGSSARLAMWTLLDWKQSVDVVRPG